MLTLEQLFLEWAWPEVIVDGGEISILRGWEIQEESEKTASSEKSLKVSQKMELEVKLHFKMTRN